MNKVTLSLFLALTATAPLGTAMAADAADEITMQVVEDDSAKTIRQQIALPAMEQERLRERKRVNQAENADALREQRQEMYEQRNMQQEQMRQSSGGKSGR